MSLKASRAEVITALFFLFLAALLLYIRPLWDIDTWWHLATGRFIIDNGMLPTSDPFNFTSSEGQGYPSVLLTGYWLAQVIMYLTWFVFGEYGLVLLVAILFLLILSIILHSGLKIFRAQWYPVILMLSLSIVIAGYFTALRPQIFSFIFALLVAFSLEGMTLNHEQGKGFRAYFILLPLLCAVWANLHRGFLVAVALMAVYSFARIITVLRRRPRDLHAEWAYFTVIALGLVSTLFNPEGYGQYINFFFFETDPQRPSYSEYMSPVILFNQGLRLYAYWVFLAATLCLVLYRIRKLPLRHILLISSLAAVSLTAFRYIPFFVFITAPMSAMILSQVASERTVLRRITRVAALLSVAACLLVSFTGNMDRLERVLHDSPVDLHRYPVKAVEFICDNKLPKPLFNHLDWGGYISWACPEYKTFIDGRILNSKAFYDYRHLLWNPSASFLLLDKYGMNTIIIPERAYISQERYTLVDLLSKSETWSLRYSDATALVFTRIQAKAEH